MPYIPGMHRTLAQLWILPVILGVIAGCSASIPYYRYVFDSEATSRHEIRRIVVRGVTLPQELRANKALIDAAIDARLVGAGFTLIPFHETQEHWQAALENGAPSYDPTTGEVDRDNLVAIYHDYLARVAQADIADAVVEPAVVKRLAKLSSKVALWDGVRRRIPTDSGNEFDWSGTGDVLSLRITVYATDGTLLLSNYGGLEYPYRHARKGRGVTSQLRDDLFANREFVEAGVRVALHPFIREPSYPERPRFYVDRID